MTIVTISAEAWAIAGAEVQSQVRIGLLEQALREEVRSRNRWQERVREAEKEVAQRNEEISRLYAQLDAERKACDARLNTAMAWAKR